MNLDIMYKGVAYSPQTKLTQPINETDTTLYVEDTSVLPPAPNIAVIGVNENAETIIYNLKYDGMLTGVQRGVEGEAKSWIANDVIARNWTNKDYSTLIDNIKLMESEFIDSNDRLTNLEYMTLQNDFTVPLVTDDGILTLVVDDDEKAILADWKYRQI